ncbi:hypothetical protein GCM10009850_113730 [Nonomuraea monospora]|uniref:Uncharacterized protein n=1 Tax=Nonomuraea monospora TaxID=568818 RepID=A0ABN3D266_9ACTN
MRIDETLLNEAKAYAARNGRSLNSVMEDALRQLLHRSTEVAERPRVELVTTDTRLKPGIELTPEFIYSLFEHDEIETSLQVRADAAQ